jgi:hypothetical protein
MSRLENLPTATALKRMMAAMVELFCDSFAEVPRRIVLDIDDTEDRVHGPQQLALLPSPTTTADASCRSTSTRRSRASRSRDPAPRQDADGTEVALVLRHVIRRIRARWPRVDIVVPRDSHYGRPEAMSWCERNRVGYVLGLAGNKVLLGGWRPRRGGGLAGRGARPRRSAATDDFSMPPRTWHAERRVIARDEASVRGSDCRFVVLQRRRHAAVALRGGLLAPAAGAENLIKAHKLQPRPRTAPRAPGPPRTSSGWCLHTAAYWLLHPARPGAEEVVLARGAVRHAPLALIKVAPGSPSWRRGSRWPCPRTIPLRDSLILLANPRREAALSRGAACPDRAIPTTYQPRFIAPPAPRLGMAITVPVPRTLKPSE